MKTKEEIKKKMEIFKKRANLKYSKEKKQTIIKNSAAYTGYLTLKWVLEEDFKK